jgi:hypothetical protein
MRIALIAGSRGVVKHRQGESNAAPQGSVACLKRYDSGRLLSNQPRHCRRMAGFHILVFFFFWARYKTYDSARAAICQSATTVKQFNITDRLQQAGSFCAEIGLRFRRHTARSGDNESGCGQPAPRLPEPIAAACQAAPPADRTQRWRDEGRRPCPASRRP